MNITNKALILTWRIAMLVGSFACSNYDSDLLPPEDSARDGVMSGDSDASTSTSDDAGEAIDAATDAATMTPAEPPTLADSGAPPPTADVDAGPSAAMPQPGLRDGQPCSSSDQCASAYCERQLCCARGSCCTSDEDCVTDEPPAYSCVEPASCQGVRRQYACSEYRCIAVEQPDDSGCDAAIEANACELYVSVTCSGGIDQPAPSCPAQCRGDEQCDAQAHCTAGACALDQPDGERCERDSQCQGGHCNAGVCCAQGDCCLRAADCPGQYAGAPNCEDTTRCQGSRRAATCTNFMCGTERVPDDSRCSGSTLASTCDVYPDLYCNGGAEQTAPACAQGCSRDSECDSNAHCNDGRCELDRENGAECSEAQQCSSQYCGQGHCCEGGDCCASDEDCSDSYTCLDVGTCQGVVQERVCSANSQCVDGTRRADARGCAGQLARSCGAYRDVRCPATAVAISPPCATSCSNSFECNWGNMCEDGACQP